MLDAGLKGAVRNGGLAEAGHFGGFYPGTVFNNVDPEGLGRVQVSCPVVSNNVFDWMEVFGQAIGSGEGFDFVPEVGCPVAVGFYGGNVNSPFCIPRSFNRVTKPSTLSSTSTKRAIESKVYRVEFDDVTSTMKIKTKTETVYLKFDVATIATLVGAMVKLGAEVLVTTPGPGGDGVVTGQCIDPFTGLPHPDTSAYVFARGKV